MAILSDGLVKADPDRKMVVIGTIFMDIKGYPEEPFYPTGRNKGRIEYIFGGVARNVAEDLAGLGYHPVFVSMADATGFGEDCVAKLKEAGVITDHILRRENCIGTWMVILTPEGDVCANLSKRQDLTELGDYLDAHGAEIISGAEGILLEIDVEESLVAKVFSLAEQFRVPVYGVTSNILIAKERMEYVRRTRCFICNRQEAGVLFDADMEYMEPDRIREMLPDAMQKAGLDTMVVTMDKDGSAYAQIGEGEIISGTCPAVPTELVDSTGAGDSFFAGVSAGLMEGMELADACRIGTRMASKVIASGENVYRPG